MSTCDNCIEETDAVVCEECQGDAWASAEDVGRQDERKLIVEWLRRENMASCTGRVLADAIERGEHLPALVATPKRSAAPKT